uniref:Uncharacterized protein n=1 Tax=Tanacetum cinerariifolium TaxID=118510 RepID=A0A699IID4_TANCI|nr:hypothetical protein [Tanacetum cinerariifolium]
MAEQQTIKYAPQWNNMTMDNVHSRNYSFTEQVNFIQQLLAYSLIIGTEIDIGEIIYSDLVTKLLNKSRLKYVSYPRFILCALQVLLGPDYTQDKNLVSPPPLAAKPKKGKSQIVTSTSPKSQDPEASGVLSKKSKRPKDITFMTPDDGTAKTTPRPEGSHGDNDSRGNKPPAYMKQQNPTDLDLLGTGAKYQEDQTQSSRLRNTNPLHPLLHIDSSSDKILKKYDNTLPLIERKLVKYLRKVSRMLFERITKDQWEKHKEETIHYVNLKAFIDDHYNENIAYRDHTDQLVESSMSFLEKSSTKINDLYKGLDVVTHLLKDITNSVKDDPATNKKIKESSLRLLPRSLHRLLRFSLQSEALISLLFSLLSKIFKIMLLSKKKLQLFG